MDRQKLFTVQDWAVSVGKFLLQYLIPRSKTLQILSYKFDGARQLKDILKDCEFLSILKMSEKYKSNNIRM